MIETLVSASVLALALLGYVSTTVSQQRLASEGTTRTRVHQVARHFLERLRADPEWSTLYARLRALQEQAETTTANDTRLYDGRRALPLTAYYEDVVVPVSLGSLAVLVDVPASRPDPDTDPTAPDVLREDVPDAQFLMPADLNGNGLIESDARDTDYVALPIVATFVWTPLGESSRELRFATGLRGER